MKGIQYCFQNERNFRFEIYATVIIILAGFIFNLSSIEWILVFILISLVLFTELINTAIERLCDRCSTQYDKRIELIKDISAGAVLVNSIIAFIGGVVVFTPRIIQFINEYS